MYKSLVFVAAAAVLAVVVNSQCQNQAYTVGAGGWTGPVSTQTVSSTGKCACFINGPPTGGGGGDCKDWTYQLDATNDASGGEIYNLRGLAFLTTSTHSYFIINSGHPLTGKQDSSSSSIDMGDILINFAPTTPYPQVDGTSSSWGIHFTPDSDAPQQDLGVFKDVVSSSVTRNPGNNGFSSLQQYMNSYGSATYGSIPNNAAAAQYWNAGSAIPNVISTATRAGGFDYLVFPADATSNVPPETCPENNNSGTRYCRNNPNALFHQDLNGVTDTHSVCAAAGRHPEIGCVDFDAAALGYNPPAGFSGTYTIGIRVPNTAFGSHAATGSSFRACYSLECGNDIACIDSSFTCPPPGPPTGGGGGGCVNNGAFADNTLFRAINHGDGSENKDYGLRLDKIFDFSESKATFSFEHPSSEVYVQKTQSSGTNYDVRVFGYVYGGPLASSSKNNPVDWVSGKTSQYYIDFTMPAMGTSTPNSNGCQTGISKYHTSDGYGIMQEVGGSRYESFSFKKRNDGLYFALETCIRGYTAHGGVAGEGWVMADVDPASGARDFLFGVGQCVDTVGHSTCNEPLCASLNRACGFDKFSCGACLNGYEAPVPFRGDNAKCVTASL